MAQFFEYIKMALENIKANKGRSILTMLGIIIGISSVILIISVGNGAEKQISDELDSIGAGQLYLYTNTSNGGNPVLITQDDMDMIKERVEHVKGITPTLGSMGSILGSKGNFDLMVQAGNHDMQYTSEQNMVRGKYFTEEDFLSANKVCVISQTDAVRMFGTDDVLGMTVEATIYNQTVDLTIVGIRSVEDGTFVSYTYEGAPIEIYMPYTTYASSFGITLDGFTGVYIVGESGQYSKEIANSTIRLLEARNQSQGEENYLIEDFNDYLEQMNTIIGTITAFVVLVASISLLVGGVGVMNIMLVSVTERTREIGIRKALGARTGSIMLQFLSESAIITLLGGIIGIILGIGGAYIICSLPMLGFKPGITLSTIAIATLFSSSVGIFFGIYPARKAAKMRPIDALRYN